MYQKPTKQPEGAIVFKILITAIFTVLAGVIVGGLIACAVGLICSSGGGGGGGGGVVGGQTVSQGDPCSSAANACGQTNVGTYVSNNNCATNPDGSLVDPNCTPTASCNATVPDNTSCPAPSINGQNGFYAQPSTIGLNSQTTLNWNSSNTTDCSLSGDNGYTYSGGASGSVTVSNLTQTTTFTLTCQDGIGGPTASKSIRVIVDPHYKEI